MNELVGVRKATQTHLATVVQGWFPLAISEHNSTFGAELPLPQRVGFDLPMLTNIQDLPLLVFRFQGGQRRSGLFAFYVDYEIPVELEITMDAGTLDVGDAIDVAQDYGNLMLDTLTKHTLTSFGNGNTANELGLSNGSCVWNFRIKSWSTEARMAQGGRYLTRFVARFLLNVRSRYEMDKGTWSPQRLGNNKLVAAGSSPSLQTPMGSIVPNQPTTVSAGLSIDLPSTGPWADFGWTLVSTGGTQTVSGTLTLSNPGTYLLSGSSPLRTDTYVLVVEPY